MVFWIAVLVGFMTLYLATRIGFFDTLVLSFNILISIYVGVYSAPTLIEFIPSAANFAYGTATTVGATSLICFLCLYGVSYVLLTGQFKVAFPKVFDLLLAGLLGLGAGILLASFMIFILSIMPFAKHAPFLDTTHTKANVSLVRVCCDQVQQLVSPRDIEQRTPDILGQIIEHAQAHVPPATTDVDPNQASDG